MNKPLPHQDSGRSGTRTRRRAARRRLGAGCFAVVILAAIIGLLPGTCAALRTLGLLPSCFAALPGSPVDLITAAPLHEVVEPQPVDAYVRAHVYRPPHGRHPALVLSLGLHPAPPDDRRVVRRLDGLARGGLVAVLIESEALNRDQLFPDLPEALVEGSSSPRRRSMYWPATPACSASPSAARWRWWRRLVRRSAIDCA